MRHELRVELSPGKNAYLYEGTEYVGLISGLREELTDGMTVTLTTGDKATEAPLTPETRDRLRDIFDESRLLPKALAELVREACSRQLAAERGAWDECAKLVGYDTMRAANDAGFDLQISWVRNAVVLKPLEDDE
jgi:hypothetical protein